MSNLPDAKGDFRELSSVFHIHDTALTGFLIYTLANQGVDVPPEMEQAMYAAADAFQSTKAAAHFLKEAEKARVQISAMPS